MDIDRMIRELWSERKRLDRLISQLETRMTVADDGAASRGRKHMSSEERLEVSHRMKAYWARRRRSNLVESGSTESDD